MEILTVGCSHTVGHTNIWQVAVTLKKLAIIIITIRFVWHGRVQHGVVYSPTLLQAPCSLCLVHPQNRTASPQSLVTHSLTGSPWPFCFLPRVGSDSSILTSRLYSLAVLGTGGLLSRSL